MAGNTGNGQPRFPGLQMFDGMMQAYTDAWRNWADTVNEVWGNVTDGEADQSDWTTGASKLMQAMSDNVRDLMCAYTGAWPTGSKHQSPLVVFVLDAAAQSSAEPSTVPLPSDVPFANVKYTDLAPLGGGTPLTDKLDVQENAAKHCLEISIQNILPSDPDSGAFVAVVYDNASPPPKRALAVVLLQLVPSVAPIV